jgi:hypothetical protein
MNRASILGCGLLLAACARDPVMVQPGLDAATAQQLFERMDRLIAALQASPPIADSSLVRPAIVAAASNTAGERIAAVEPTASKDGLAELRERLAALERELARIRGGAAMHAWAAEPFVPTPPTLHAAVDQLQRQLADEDSVSADARRTLFRRTEAQVLQLLGSPTGTVVGDHGYVHWYYRTSNGNAFGVVFVNGLVAKVD